MRALFVTPSEISTGEAVTVLHMALDITRRQGECAFLASPFTAGLLEEAFPGRVRRLITTAPANREVWTRTVEEFAADVIVFADYPLLRFATGSVPLVDEGAIAALADSTVIVTLDHLGYAQGPGRIYFGPAHISMQSETLPSLPEWMQILLPCPMNAPDAGTRRGTPFQFGPRPLPATGSAVDATRRHYLESEPGRLVVHVMSNWASRFARHWNLPHHVFLPGFFEASLGGTGERVVVVSVNHGGSLPNRTANNVTVLNSAPLPPEAYNRLIDAADLVITDNAVSATVGRRICLGEPVARLHNPRRLLEIVQSPDGTAKRLAMAVERVRPGAVFPFEVFPIWDAATLRQLGLFEANPVTRAVQPIDFFGGEDSAVALRALLTDEGQRQALRDRQLAYVDDVLGLPGPFDALDAHLSNGRPA
jgi:hypothetical protein